MIIGELEDIFGETTRIHLQNTEMENMKDRLRAVEDNIKELKMNKRIWSFKRQK